MQPGRHAGQREHVTRISSVALPLQRDLVRQISVRRSGLAAFASGHSPFPFVRLWFASRLLRGQQASLRERAGSRRHSDCYRHAVRALHSRIASDSGRPCPAARPARRILPYPHWPGRNSSGNLWRGLFRVLRRWPRFAPPVGRDVQPVPADHESRPAGQQRPHFPADVGGDGAHLIFSGHHRIQ